MPFYIIRNDITKMQVDAIVNTANPDPVVGYGVDAGIHKSAGWGLLRARKKIGRIGVGEAVITPGFDLESKYVIHTVGPVWKDGDSGEEEKLCLCYENSLKLAVKKNCESVAFPLISAGNHGFPKPLALQTAVNVFTSFLMKHEMEIYLVVFSKDAFALSEKLFHSVKSYIDDRYTVEKTLDEYGVENKCNVREAQLEQICRSIDASRRTRFNRDVDVQKCESTSYVTCPCSVNNSLEDMLKNADMGFSEMLLKLIDRTGKKDSDIYKKANVDRKLFSKIRNNPDYKPSKATALAFAIALELSLEETKDFIATAGFALSHSNKSDIIIEYFISNNNYDMFEINETLFAFDQNLLGA